MSDLVSVIVPVWNAEKYVQQTLDSIVNQTYKNFEILVIDDGSTDGSPSICDRFAVYDDRVQVFHRHNCGLSGSRQFGIDNCRGEYFVTVDSDDYVSEEYVEKLYRTIKENEADIAVCGVSCFWDGKDEISTVFMPFCSNEKLSVTREILASDFYQLSTDLLLTDSWNKIYRTQFVRDSNVKFELGNVYNGTDMQFNHRLLLHCPVYCICRESLLFHRNHSGSRMQRKDKPFQESFEIIMDSLIEECKLVGISIREQLSRVYYGMMSMVIWDIDRLGGSIKEKLRKFQALVLKNRRFLKDHRDCLDRYKGFKMISSPDYSSRFAIPAFTLSNALWLDAVFFCYHSLSKVKNIF